MAATPAAARPIAHAALAVVELLKTSTDVLAQYLVEVPASHIVGGELPAKLIGKMPTAAILVTEAGGLRPKSQAPEFRARVDVRSYGTSSWRASSLSSVVHSILQGQANTAAAHTVVVGVTQTGGPIPFAEPDLPDWYSTLRSYTVLINEVPST